MKAKCKAVFFLLLLTLVCTKVFALSFVQVTSDPWYDPEIKAGGLNCNYESDPFPVDWDHDGDYDIITALGDGSGIDDDLCLLEQRADNSFLMSKIADANRGGGTVYPIVIDWENDGEYDFYDLVLGTTDAVYGNGDQMTSYGVDYDEIQPAMVDWNGSGIYDLLALGSCYGIIDYYKNDGTNHFSTADLLTEDWLTKNWMDLGFEDDNWYDGCGGSITVGDIDEDGFIDLVVGDYEGHLTLYLNDGTNDQDHPFTVKDTGTLPSDTNALRATPEIVDWDQDGHPDIIRGMKAGYIALYLNDYDEDGFVGEDDCDNENSAAYVGATEVCDGADNDCDGEIDENGTTDGTTYYADNDADTFGDASNTIVTCDESAPTGYVTNNTDCNDNAATATPNGTEVCDNIDNDCDGTVDESDASDAITYYADSDGDGLGNADSSITLCQAPASGFVTNNSDCDDTEETLTTDCPVNSGSGDTESASSSGCSLQNQNPKTSTQGSAIVLFGVCLLLIARQKRQGF